MAQELSHGTEAAKDKAHLKEEVEQFRAKIAQEANRIVHQQLPLKILFLSKLIKETPMFYLSYSEIMRQEKEKLSTGSLTSDVAAEKSKKRKLENEGVSPKIPSNQIITSMLKILKDEFLQLIEMLNTLKVWVQLNIPQIEDGNNFGVGVQEETVGELGRAETDTFAILDNMTKYFVTRGKLLVKMKKHPDIEDFAMSVDELDEKEFINMRLCAADLRNTFALIYDVITKNLEKIQKPRSNHLATLF